MQFDEENPDQKNTRYLLLIYFAKNIPAFRACGMEIHNSIYFSLYGLGKVAESLAKDWPYHQLNHDNDLAKIEDDAYANMSERDLVDIKRIGPIAYIAITEKGRHF